MRLLAITTSFPRDEEDHAGRFVHDLHAGLMEEGHAVTTLRPSHPGVTPRSETEAGLILAVPYDRPECEDLFYGDGLESNFRRVARPWRKLRRFMAKTMVLARPLLAECDAILVHWLWPNGAMGVRMAREAGCRLLGVAHGGDVGLLARPILGRVLSRGLSGRFDGVLCTSSQGLEVVRARVSPRRAMVAPMGIDPRGFAQRDGSRLSGWPAEYLLGLGRLVNIKGFDLLIRAGRALDLPVVLAGAGPEEESLRRLAGEVGGSVTFAGSLPRRHVLAALVHARAVVIPSRRLARGRVEGCPVVAVEARAVGVPVVASATGGLMDLLPEAALHRANDLDDLLRVLRGVLSAPKRPAPVLWSRRDAARKLLHLLEDDGPGS